MILSRKFNEMAERLRELLLDLPQHSLIDHEHVFSPGPPGFVLWSHQVAVPAGTIVETIQHKFPNVFMMTGTVLVWDNQNETPYWIAGPVQGRTPAGVKRIVLHMTDVVWTRVMCIPDTFNNKPDEALEFISE